VEEQAQILQAHEACKQAWESNDPKEYYKLNEVFHHAVYAASHNSFLEERAELLHRRLRPYRRLQLHVRNRMRNSFDEHEKIVRALLDGNSTLAADLLRAHVVVQGEKFTDLMSNMDSLKKPELAGAA
jgi:DNA-binding GntR family transcriptional regulator